MLKTRYKTVEEYSGYFNKSVYRVYRTNENQATAIALTIPLISSLSFLIFINSNNFLVDIFNTKTETIEG